MEKHRCDWGRMSPKMQAYHDTRWCKPLHDERELFAMLILEGAQAGLSWSTIIEREENYRRAFDGFAPAVVQTQQSLPGCACPDCAGAVYDEGGDAARRCRRLWR